MLKNELQAIDNLARRLREDPRRDDPDLSGSIGSSMQFITVAWEKAVFSGVPSHTLLRYFHYHLEGIRRISDTLYLSSDTICTTAYAEETYHLLQKQLTELTVYLEKNFQPYFNPQIFASRIYNQHIIAELKNQHTQLIRLFEKIDIPRALKTCLLDYFAVMMADHGETGFTFAALFYFRRLLLKIVAAASLNAPGNASAAIIDVLTAHNFNHLSFLTFKVESISGGLNQLLLSDKLSELRLKLYELKWTPGDQTAYDPAWPSLNTMLAGWITEEIALTETALRDQALQTCYIKLPLNLSVAQLACLLRLFYEESLIPYTSLTDIFRFVSIHYKSKRQDSISAASLSKEFYSISQVTAAVVRDMLQKMISRINRSFFPVWAAAFLIIHFSSNRW